MINNKPFVIDPFCLRQFDEKATNRIEIDPKDFLKEVNKQQHPLKDGYAPFCKHVFIPNFTNLMNNTVKITEENEHLIRTQYKARTEKELPVLMRYFPKDQVKIEKAMFLDVILYSKEQIQKENEAKGDVDPNKDIDYDWGIISIKPQDVDYEIPMLPITMMRNAVGKEEGGSGVPLVRELYLQSVEFWSQHALAD